MFLLFNGKQFMECLPSLYPLLVDCLGTELVPDLRIYVQLCLRKVGQHALGLDLQCHSPQLPVANPRPSSVQHQSIVETPTTE
jgi:hypothetical protein